MRTSSLYPARPSNKLLCFRQLASRLYTMPTTFSSLPADVHIAIIKQIGDFRSLVAFSRVNRAQAALVSTSVSQERWRCLLAVEHIGMAIRARDSWSSWSDLAAQVVNHCAGCRLCKMVLDDMSSQCIRPHAVLGSEQTQLRLQLGGVLKTLRHLQPQRRMFE
jgi:hypothetical protein